MLDDDTPATIPTLFEELRYTTVYEATGLRTPQSPGRYIPHSLVIGHIGRPLTISLHEPVPHPWFYDMYLNRIIDWRLVAVTIVGRETPVLLHLEPPWARDTPHMIVLVPAVAVDGIVQGQEATWE